MTVEGHGASQIRRRGVLLANVLVSAFIFHPRHRPFSSSTRWLTFAAWATCRSALIHGVMCPNSALFGPVIRRFRPVGREIWLTLDDGPDPRSTPALLDLLGEYEARATFFMIGNRVEAHPTLARLVAEGGHSVGNHTHTHSSASLWAGFPSRLRAEVVTASAAIEQASGIRPRLFRSPAGLSSPWLHSILARHGLRRVGWSARGYDGFDRLADGSVERILRAIQPGSLILFHGEGRAAETGPARLRKLLRHLSRDGYRFVVPER